MADSIPTQVSTKTLVQFALRYLSIRIRSKQELIEYLSHKTSDEHILAEAITYLEDNHLIDDGAFAKAWIESRLRHGKGDRLISLELRQKGLSAENIHELLQAVSDSIWDEAVDTVVRKYQTKWAHLNGYQKKAKIYQVFMSRGFSSNRIDAFLKDRVK